MNTGGNIQIIIQHPLSILSITTHYLNLDPWHQVLFNLYSSMVYTKATPGKTNSLNYTILYTVYQRYHYVYKCYYCSFFYTLKWVKRFCLENTVGFNNTHKAPLNYTKDQGLEQKGGSQRCQWLTGECSSAGLTQRWRTGWVQRASCFSGLAAPTVLTCPHTRPYTIPHSGITSKKFPS